MHLRHSTLRDRLIAGLCTEGLCYSQADIEARRLERAARSGELHERRSARARIALLTQLDGFAEETDTAPAPGDARAA